MLTISTMTFAQTPKGTTDMWDFVNSFTTSTGRQHGVAYDGEYIYTCAWGKSSTVLSMFYKYDMEGNLLDEFDVAGVNQSDNYMRDMTYDGQYFYGCDAHSSTIWCYDLHNKTLVTSNCINTSLSELGHCSYDPNHDAFWVGERASGEGVLYLDLKLVNRSGEVIQTATPANLNGHTVHGTGYFVDENGQAHLYLNAVEGFTDHVFDYNIDTDVMDPNYIFDFSQTPGWGPASSAGGAYIGVVNGTQYFFGDVDKSPNLIGIYALGEYVPVTPVAPEGDIFFDFEDGIMRLNAIDADEDGFNWEMRAIYAVPGNTHCVTSASFDDWTQTVLFPENYLVTPYMLDCEQITFKAQAQDQLHPNEHFGVAVSTTGATADDFEIVWDAELTAKTVGDWYDFNVDLRAFQGQDIYVAIVHYNCTNQFSLNIDDIMLHRKYDETWNVSENATVMCNVFPNPTSEMLTVENSETVSHYEVYNIVGEMLMSQPVDGKTFNVNVSELPAGTYLIKTTSEGMVQTMRFVKK